MTSHSLKIIVKLTMRICLIALLLCYTFNTIAQSLKPYAPTRQEVIQSYKNAALLDSLARNNVFKSNVKAWWQPDGNGFLYRNSLADGKSEYLYVNAANGAKSKAFDEAKLAQALNKVADTNVVAGKLPFTNMQFDKTHQNIFLQVKKKWYKCDLKNYGCLLMDSFAIQQDDGIVTGNIKSRWERQPVADSLSPDKQKAAFIKDGNVFIQTAKGNPIEQITNDGDTAQPYGQMQWSPDSKHLVVFRIRPVIEKPVYYILSSVDSTTRGVLKSHEYAQPGDPFTSYEMFTVNLEDKKLVKVKTELYDFLDYPWIHWRSGDNRYFVYEKANRGHQRFRMIEVDALNGDTKNILDEKTNTFIYESRIFTWYIANTNEIIWTSEKDGWNHLYLVDAVKGGIKNQITKGNWVVRDVDSVDEEKRVIWFRASGVNPGEDPYNIHYYRIGFDGNNLVSLTAANAHHLVSFFPGPYIFYRQLFEARYARRYRTSSCPRQ